MTNQLSGTVRDVMSEATHVVSAIGKISEVAKLFCENRINSAPVVDEAGHCIGLITSSDLVRFQSQVDSEYSRIDHGMSFDVTQSENDGPIELVPHPFDEVQRHMSSGLQTISPDRSLSDAARIMTEQHIHHLIVLDESERPIGIVSSLDLLTKLIEVL